MRAISICIFSVALVASCQPSESKPKEAQPQEINYYKLPAKHGAHINMVVEIPAGEHLKTEYQPETNEFTVELRDGKPRKVKFLPYPGNYGFVPSTFMDKERGGDGDALDILLIGERVESKSIVQVIAIGVLMLKDRGEEDNKLLAIPVDETLRISDCTTLECFREHHPGLIEIIEQWYQLYKGPGMMEWTATLGKAEADAEIEKWLLP